MEIILFPLRNPSTTDPIPDIVINIRTSDGYIANTANVSLSFTPGNIDEIQGTDIVAGLDMTVGV